MASEEGVGILARVVHERRIDGTGLMEVPRSVRQGQHTAQSEKRLCRPGVYTGWAYDKGTQSYILA